MSFARNLFIFIDKAFDRQQNRLKMLRFKDAGIIEEKDIAYGETEPEKLDTYFIPKADGGKYPVFFCIHGGGFVAGDKYYRRGLARYVASLGYFVVSINYALSPQYKFPTGLKQVVKALNWVGANAENYNLDLDNMCVSGDSAGGYYSAMLSCISTSPALQERFGVSTNLKFRAAMLDCGVYDIAEALKNKVAFNLTEKILKDFCAIRLAQLENYEYYDVLAPLAYVDEKFPISFVFYAERDVFCKGQGQKLISKLEELGIHVESHHSTKFTDNHCYPLNWNVGAAIEGVAKMTDFLKRVAAKEI